MFEVVSGFKERKFQSILDVRSEKDSLGKRFLLFVFERSFIFYWYIFLLQNFVYIGGI